eukprot:7282306-Prymnesium_polylepis.1
MRPASLEDVDTVVGVRLGAGGCSESPRAWWGGVVGVRMPDGDLSGYGSTMLRVALTDERLRYHGSNAQKRAADTIAVTHFAVGTRCRSLRRFVRHTVSACAVKHIRTRL